MGSIEVPNSGTVYVDTVAIIYALEEFKDYKPILAPFWEASESGRLTLITSELALMEVLVGPLKSGRRDLQKTYEKALLTSSITLVPISQVILREAARLRAAMPRLRTPDAIHAATALCHDCALFLTNDHGLRETPGLAVAILDDALPS